MSERMPAEIWIGGKIVDSAVPDLCAAIARERVLAEWGDGPFHPAIAEDLIEAVRPNGEQVPLLWLCDDQALWGEFASLERFLQEHQISFTRLSAGRYEYDPEMVTYRPGTGRVELVTNSSGAGGARQPRCGSASDAGRHDGRHADRNRRNPPPVHPLRSGLPSLHPPASDSAFGGFRDRFLHQLGACLSWPITTFSFPK